MLDNKLNRRQLMRVGGAGLGAAVLTACGTNKTPVVVDPIKPQPKPQPGRGGNTLLRIFACSGFLEKSDRINTAVSRLNACGFQVSNAEAAYPVTNALPVPISNAYKTCKTWPQAAWPHPKSCSEHAAAMARYACCHKSIGTVWAAVCATKALC